MFLYDPTYLLLIPAIILAMWSQSRVKSTYAKYSRIRSQRGLSGAQVAERILRDNGIHNVRVEETQGVLSDHYDPTTRTVRLSPHNYRADSLAAVAVAAHECGHAIQHARAYSPLALRSAILPVANIGSSPLIWVLVMAGFLFSFPALIDAGIVFFSGAVLFHLVTLPVEFNASSRALAILSSNGYLATAEQEGARKVLNAAALTYVASATVSVLNLVRLLILRNSMRD